MSQRTERTPLDAQHLSVRAKEPKNGQPTRVDLPGIPIATRWLELDTGLPGGPPRFTASFVAGIDGVAWGAWTELTPGHVFVSPGTAVSYALHKARELAASMHRARTVIASPQ